MKTPRQKFTFRIALNIKPQQALIAAVLLLFLFVVAWNRPYVLPMMQHAQPTQAPTSTLMLNATPSTIPVENPEPMHEDTTGIIIGGIVLVLTVVGGTLTSILRKPNTKH